MDYQKLKALRHELTQKINKETAGLPITLVMTKVMITAYEYLEKAYDMGWEDRNRKDFKVGVQIAYIPTHAKDNICHHDVEFGFVTEVKENGCFCRYWMKGRPGQPRTVANSEMTRFEDLIIYQSVNQDLVTHYLLLWGYMK